MILILPLLLPIAAGLFIWALPKGKPKLERSFVTAALMLTAACALFAACIGERSLTLWRLTDAIAIALRSDGPARLYLALISVVWVLAGIYALAYNAHDPHARRYNCFYLCTY